MEMDREAFTAAAVTRSFTKTVMRRHEMYRAVVPNLCSAEP